MDTFFAAIEEKKNPRLTNKPIIISGHDNPSKKKVISTANYKTKKYKIHSTIPIHTAFKLYPKTIFLPINYKVYSAVSKKFKSILLTITPLIKNTNINKTFLDISEVKQTSTSIAAKIKKDIK